MLLIKLMKTTQRSAETVCYVNNRHMCTPTEIHFLCEVKMQMPTEGGTGTKNQFVVILRAVNPLKNISCNQQNIPTFSSTPLSHVHTSMQLLNVKQLSTNSSVIKFILRNHTYLC